MTIRDGLSFDDVLLVPKYGHLRKREAADLTSRLVGDILLDIPIVSAPMQSVTEEKMAQAMNAAGGFGIVHRFMSIEDQAYVFSATSEVPKVARLDNAWAGAAIGVNEGYERWKALYDAGCRVFCLDIAHAHHETVSDFIKNRPPDLYLSRLIAGNIATKDGAIFLASLGVDSIKVGIGPGAACSTRQVTGFGIPQLTAIIEVREQLDIIRHRTGQDITLIADGGIKTSGDIVKALAAGADTVMIGRLLAGCDESPHPGLYWGMASKRVNGHHAPEGVEGAVPHTGSVKDTLKPLVWGIRSGVSYGGGTDLLSLRENAEFIRVSSLASLESGVRV